MKSHVSPDRVQGQLLAMNVLIETILRTLPAHTMRQVSRTYSFFAPEVAGHLLDSSGNEALHEAYSQQVDANSELLKQILQSAITRDNSYRSSMNNL